MNRQYLWVVFLLQFACILEIKNENQNLMMISNFYVEYDQIVNEIFLQVHTELANELIESVNVKMKMDDNQFDETILLNDSGLLL